MITSPAEPSARRLMNVPSVTNTRDLHGANSQEELEQAGAYPVLRTFTTPIRNPVRSTYRDLRRGMRQGYYPKHAGPDADDVVIWANPRLPSEFDSSSCQKDDIGT